MTGPVPIVAVPTTTQQQFPGRATARTVVQQVLGYVIALGIVIPTALAIVREELAEFLPEQVVAVLVTIGVVAAAVSAIAARVMAIPQVDAWLRKPHLSSSPDVGRHVAPDDVGRHVAP